jgi:hypothetical protein
VHLHSLHRSCVIHAGIVLLDVSPREISSSAPHRYTTLTTTTSGIPSALPLYKISCSQAALNANMEHLYVSTTAAPALAEPFATSRKLIRGTMMGAWQKSLSLHGLASMEFTRIATMILTCRGFRSCIAAELMWQGDARCLQAL